MAGHIDIYHYEGQVIISRGQGDEGRFLSDAIPKCK